MLWYDTYKVHKQKIPALFITDNIFALCRNKAQQKKNHVSQNVSEKWRLFLCCMIIIYGLATTEITYCGLYWARRLETEEVSRN